MVFEQICGFRELIFVHMRQFYFIFVFVYIFFHWLMSAIDFQSCFKTSLGFSLWLCLQGLTLFSDLNLFTKQSNMQ